MRKRCGGSRSSRGQTCSGVPPPCLSTTLRFAPRHRSLLLWTKEEGKKKTLHTFLPRRILFFKKKKKKKEKSTISLCLVVVCVLEGKSLRRACVSLPSSQILEKKKKVSPALPKDFWLRQLFCRRQHSVYCCCTRSRIFFFLMNHLFYFWFLSCKSMWKKKRKKGKKLVGGEACCIYH